VQLMMLAVIHALACVSVSAVVAAAPRAGPKNDCTKCKQRLLLAEPQLLLRPLGLQT